MTKTPLLPQLRHIPVLFVFALIALFSCVVVVDITTGYTEDAPEVVLSSSETSSSTDTDAGTSTASSTTDVSMEAHSATALSTTGDVFGPSACNQRFCER